MRFVSPGTPVRNGIEKNLFSLSVERASRTYFKKYYPFDYKNTEGALLRGNELFIFLRI